MLEEERKYEVDAGFRLPDLSGCAPEGGRVVVRPPQKLRATYYDTEDLRLARSGASLRFRRGDDEPWTVKLPTDAPGVRNEISLPGPASTVPERLLELVTAYTRGAAVTPAIVLSTVRQAYQLCDRDDRVAVEVVDDAVSVIDGRRVVLRFREIEVERKAGKAKLLDRVEIALRDAGAVVGEFTPKHVRALGLPALEPPDWPAPPARLPKKPTAGEVVTAALRRDVARIVAHDCLVRLRAPVGRDDTAVHQMRVGCRRLRSDLRTFAGLLERDWTSALRTELGWLAHALGAARDAEVLRLRLRQTAHTDPLAPLDAAAVARIDADLAARHEDALQALDKVMTTERYHRLLDALLTAATQPRISRRADEPAEAVLPGLVGRPWRRLAYGGDGVVGACQLDPAGADADWHGVRISGKRARYAVEAVAGVLGGEAAALSRALAAVQDLLGEHQDAAVAADTWLAIANADPDDHALAITAGRLYERERAGVQAARGGVPAGLAGGIEATVDAVVAVGPVRAAGGVLWRRGPTGSVDVAVVHRPRLDDWSLPKGKLHRREHPLVGAHREVMEETGVRPRVGARLPTVSYRVEILGELVDKVVDYWAMTVDADLGFTPGKEVDALAWVGVGHAFARLTYSRDLTVLKAFEHLGPLPEPVILLRNASAVQAARDDERPLNRSGWAQARQLAKILPCFTPTRLRAAPARRCVQTLEPAADALGLPIEVDAGLDGDPEKVAKGLRTTGDTDVVCGRGSLVQGVLGALGGTDAASYGTPRGTGWVLSFHRRAVAAADELR